MHLNERRSARHVPARVLVLSVATLAVPVIGSLAFPDRLGGYGPLLWLVALVPVFVLAYHRGRRGAVWALGLGLATMAVTVLAAWSSGQDLSPILPGIMLAYVAISIAVGWVAEVLHRHRDEVEDLAFTDLLTGLPNRRHARVFLENEFAAAERGRFLSVILFDLDQFKQYNDTYGHPTADDALRIFSDMLAQNTRRMNLSARFGGEEFLTVLTGTDLEGAFIFAERVRTALRARNLGSPPLTVSAGVAEFRSTMVSPEELIAAADRALYTAKGAGRNCVRVAGYRSFQVRSIKRPKPEDGETQHGEVSSASGAQRTELTTEEMMGGEPAFGAGHRILVIEYDPQVRRLVATSLARDGFSVVESVSLTSALTRLDEEFDVVLADLDLLGEQETGFVSAVKERWPATQVIATTGLQDNGPHPGGDIGRADRHLLKPYGVPELRAEIGQAIAVRLGVLADGPGGLNGTSHDPSWTRAEGLDGARALAQAVELRDSFTRGHWLLLAEYARVLADLIDPDERLLDREVLRLACELQDVGKIAVPETILNKEGRLTADEIKQVRLHPEAGRRILEAFLEDETVLAAVRSHHERWDGRGYPDGLAGEAIPLAARVMSLAEGLAAMTRPRAYRGALSWDETLAAVRELSGHQFDPTLVALLEAAEPDLRSVALRLLTGTVSTETAATAKPDS